MPLRPEPSRRSTGATAERHRTRGIRSVGAVAVIALAALLSLGACSSSDERTVDVYAASSLTEAYQTLEERFEAENPGVDVRLNLAGSNALQRQILDGAGAHVFAPADVTLIDEITDLLADDATVYASNRLTLVAATGDDGDAAITSTAELADDGLLVARCAAGVPCGDATDRYLRATELSIGRSTDEPNVRSVLLKVANGEADAGFVYRTDAEARADAVTEIVLANPPTVDLAVAVLSEDADARAFARFVLSAEAAEVFRSLGFVVP